MLTKEFDGALPVVLDTNILVSALLAGGHPALIVDEIAGGRIIPYFDDRILCEYWDVLNRPKFGFTSLQVNRLIHDISKAGFGIEVSAPSVFLMPDEDDRKFYDIANTANAILITGNTKHYPNEPFILTPTVFVQRYFSENREQNK